MTQDVALSILKTGKNVFLTGEPGSGKTHAVNGYVAYLKSCGIKVAVTASTGIAATHINGMTVHSWSGIGIKKKFDPSDLKKIIKYRGKKIDKTNVLIIDEISMIDASVLDLVDMACRAVKKSELPFGGLQIVFVGDFFQLPPVRREDEEPYKFAFESGAWRNANPAVCYLSEQHRQSDKGFLSVLSAIRSNNITDDCRELLDGCLTKALSHKAKITKLFPHNADVDKINSEELKKLPAQSTSFLMKSRGADRFVEQLKKGCLSPENLELRKGAEVMFTKNNFEKRYVNGTLGTVTGFEERDELGRFDEDENYGALPIVKTRQGRKITVEPAEWSIEENGEVLASIEQLPLRLAWAMTVHKSQGITLDEAFIDLRGAFVEGQGYVALSRVKSLEGLYLAGYNENALQVHSEVFERDRLFRKRSAELEDEFSDISKDGLKLKFNTFLLSAGGKSPKKYSTKNAMQHSNILENVGMSKKEFIRSAEFSGKAYSVEAIRNNYPKAYSPWNEEEEEILVNCFRAGQTLGEIAETLGRKKGAIHSRLVKIGLIKK